MNVATIEMDRDEAKQRFEEYRAGLEGREATEEDKGIMIGFQAIASGKSLINLDAVMRATPFDGNGFPRLASARAHWKWCHLHMNDRGTIVFAERRGDATNQRAAW